MINKISHLESPKVFKACKGPESDFNAHSSNQMAMNGRDHWARQQHTMVESSEKNTLPALFLISLLAKIKITKYYFVVQSLLKCMTINIFFMF